MIKKSVVAAGAALAFASLAIAPAADAYRGDPSVKGPNFTPERHEAMVKAFETLDYAKWKELMGDRPIAAKISEGEFQKFVEMRKLRLEGRHDEADALRAEIGLGNGDGQKHRHGQGDGHGERREK